jgi:hypothetical protein
MSDETLQLIKQLEAQLEERKSIEAKPEMRLSATEGLMQQIYCKTNPAGFEQLVQEQLKVLRLLIEEQPKTLEVEVAEDFADKVWIMDIRSDMDQLLSWEKSPPSTWQDKIGHAAYITIILMVLVATLVGIKTIIEFLF